jgi:hypothetical protein
MLNGKQNAKYRPLVNQAWAAHCARNMVCIEDRPARDAWYRKALLREFGVDTTKEIRSDEKTFERLCLYFATLAGDQEQIQYWACADERRALWRLQQTMKNAGVDTAYVRGIARNMNMGDRPIEDLPAELILKLNTAVFIYMKRTQKKSSSVPCRAAACSVPLESDPALSFP